MTKEEIGAKLRAQRVACGMTQQEVAEKIGRKQPIIGHWETGYSQPDANTLFILCDIYNTTVDEVFGFSKDKSSFTKQERDHIKKYHSLDDLGRAHVDAVLDWEAKRSAQVKEAQDRIAELESQTSAIIELQPHTDSRVRLTEYYRSASAGGGIFILGNEASEQIAIPATPENELVDYVIKVSGDSMEPDYHDGDNVMVSQRLEMRHGDVGIFVINGKAYIKEYGGAELISRNPSSENIKIAEHDNIVCMGKVVGKLE